MSEPRYMRAYYHEFKPTECDSVDAVLEAIAMAGRAYHSTECWDEAEHLGPEGYWTLIQTRANEAATLIRRLEAENAAQAKRIAKLEEALRKLIDTQQAWKDQVSAIIRRAPNVHQRAIDRARAALGGD